MKEHLANMLSKFLQRMAIAARLLSLSRSPPPRRWKGRVRFGQRRLNRAVTP